MRRAALCLSFLTRLFRNRPPARTRRPPTSSSSFAAAAEKAGSGGRYGPAVLIGLLLPLVCGGCAPAPQDTAAPVLIGPVPCARPAMPALPRLSGLSFLESREGYELLRLRDGLLRAYTAGLEDALDCYEAQVLPPAGRDAPKETEPGRRP